MKTITNKNQIRSALKRAEILRRNGRYLDAARRLEKLISLNWTSKFKALAVEALSLLGNTYRLVGEPHNALAKYELASKFAKGDIQQSADIKRLIGFLRIQMYQDVEVAERYARDAIEIGRQNRNKKLESNGIALMAIVFENRKKLDTALAWYFNALKLAREARFYRREMTVLSDIGRVNASKGNYFNALKYLNEALKVAKKHETRSSVITNLSRLAQVHSEIGDADKALKLRQEALKIAETSGYEAETYETQFDLAGYLLTQKNYKEAKKHLLKAYKIVSRLGQNRRKINCLITMARADAEISNYDDSLVNYWTIFEQIKSDYTNYLTIFEQMIDGMAAIFERLDKPNVSLFVQDASRFKDLAKEEGIYGSYYKSQKLQELCRNLIRELENIKASEQGYFVCGDLRCNMNDGSFENGDRKGRLTDVELRIFLAIYQRRPKLYSLKEIKKDIFNYDDDYNTQTPYVHISRINGKFGIDVIKNIRGKGWYVPPSL